MKMLVLPLMLAAATASAGSLTSSPQRKMPDGRARVGSMKVAIEIHDSSAGRTPPNACYRIDSLCKAQGWEDSIVTGTDIDSASELADYSVVVTGDIGIHDNDFRTYEGALKDWVRGGGGFVGLGWIVYGVYRDSAWQMDSIMAVAVPWTTTSLPPARSA